MSALDPVILNEVKLTQKAIEGLAGPSSSGPTEYPWEVFTSSRSWTVPEDGEYFILCLGGGAGRYGEPSSGGGASGGYGGGGGASAGYGGGGGGMSVVRRKFLKSATLVLTVGSGGSLAGNGGASAIVGAELSISCGGGSSGGSGGASSGGDLNFIGGSGGGYNGSGGGGGGGAGGGAGGNGLGPFGGHGGFGGGGGGLGISSSTTGASGSSGVNGEVPSFLSSIPGYRGPGYTNAGRGGQGFIAIRRVK